MRSASCIRPATATSRCCARSCAGATRWEPFPGTDADPADVREALPAKLIAVVFIPFASGFFLSILLRYVNAVIARDLAADFALSPSDLGLLTSAYFLVFAAFQIPLGVLLDRFGPRRVLATLLVFAAAGGLIFGLAQGVATLALGRALLGLGVSGCLMGSIKAFTLWFPLSRLATLNGWILAIGALGAMAATAPVEALAVVAFFAIAAGVGDAALAIVMLYGFGACAAALPYAILSQHFPRGLTGRVITAANIFMFLASFAFQWGVGVLLRLWPAVDGRYPAEGYAVAFGIIGVLQLAVLLWLLPMREKPG